MRDVGFGFPVAFALLIELVSAFGPVGIATYAAATKGTARHDVVASPTSPATLSPEARRIADHEVGSVVDFVAEETVPASEAGAIGGAELHEEYARWCRERERIALAPLSFLAEFDRLRELPALKGKVRKFGSRYFGIALARRTQRSLSHGGS